MDTPLLQVKDLSVHFPVENGVARAVDGVSFQIARGETHVLVGESGCGKSVTALTVAGLLPRGSRKIVRGEVWLNNINLTTISRREYRMLRGGRISMIFQEPMTSLNPVMKIGVQIEEVISLHLERALPERSSRNKAGIRRRALELMEETGLANVEKLYSDYPHQLSGGMRQRIMIAIALASKPDLIIADEPTTALDVTVQAQILKLMEDLRKNTGSSILLITHDLGVAASMGHSMSVMYAGQVVEEGRVKDVFRNPCHPYTRALFNALPSRISEQRGKLNAIQGSVPPATSYDSIESPCRFFDRCPYQDERCYQKPVEPGHRSRCGRDPAF